MCDHANTSIVESLPGFTPDAGYFSVKSDGVHVYCRLCNDCHEVVGRVGLAELVRQPYLTIRDFLEQHPQKGEAHACA
jgi:hypothetical protein